MFTHLRLRPPLVPRPAMWTIIMEFLVFYYLPAAFSAGATAVLSVHILTTHAFLLLTMGAMMRRRQEAVARCDDAVVWSIRRRLQWKRDHDWPHLLLLLLTLFFVLLLSLLRETRRPAPLEAAHDLGGLDGRLTTAQKRLPRRDDRVRIRPCPDEDRLRHVDVLLACDVAVSRAHSTAPPSCDKTVWQLQLVEIVLHPSTRCTPRHVRIAFPHHEPIMLTIQSAGPHPHQEENMTFPLVVCPATVTFAGVHVRDLDASSNEAWTLSVEGFEPTTRSLRAEWQDARWAERPARLYLAPLRVQECSHIVGGHVLFRWTTFWQG